MNILVTGGAGYIGSHTCVELLNAGYGVTVVDNLVNSKVEAIRRVEKITDKQVRFHEVDLLDRDALDEVFAEQKFDAVIHFAGLKAVGESVDIPLRYYHNNLTGTLVLCEMMEKHGVDKIVFSSSATVYGDPHTNPITEDFPVGGVTNPYGRTKEFIEYILRDAAVANPDWKVDLLRYFNPVGAHKSGLIGEDPNDIPNNLTPYISQVAVGKLKELQVFGADYETPDGTGIRDYIHVVDLALGHLKALEHIDDIQGAEVYNLGTGRGYSVFEMVAAFEKACGCTIPYQVVGRRSGDVAVCYADSSKAERELGWKAERGVEEMCADSWRWQSMNPEGF